MRSRGYFISFEGMDGSGKSTQIELLGNWLKEKSFDVLVTREPGGTHIGEKIREIILDPDNEEMDDVTEAYLYASSRAQLVRELVRPAVAEGKIVICDRFIDSSIAYQGHGRSMGELVSQINHVAVDDCMPDLTFYLRIEPEGGHGRIHDRELDRMELQNAEFHQRTYEGYEELAAADPERIAVIDAGDSIENIHRKITERVNALLEVYNSQVLL